MDPASRTTRCGERSEITDPWSVSSGRVCFSLERSYLHSQSRVLDGNRLMSTEEQADESKHEPEIALASLYSFPSIPLKVNALLADGILANHSPGDCINATSSYGTSHLTEPQFSRRRTSKRL